MTKRYNKNSSTVSRKVANEIVLVPIRQNVGDLQNIYTMNEVGSRIWELLDSGEEVADIILTISSEYEVEKTQAEADVIDFLEHLESVGAIDST
jgi:hypothetical protein